MQVLLSQSRYNKMCKVILLALIVCVAVVTSANEWNDVPDDDLDNDSSLEKRRECRDKYSNCRQYDQYCHNTWIKSNCPRTCLNCRQTNIRSTPRPTLSRRIPTCISKESRYCKIWQEMKYCKKDHTYYLYMKKNCPGACGFCRLPKKPAPKGAQTVPVNTQECLDAHNKYRKLHGVPLLHWNKALADDAREYAYKLAKIKRMIHASVPEGENLAMRRTRGSPSKLTCAQATELWYNEVEDYDFSKPGFSPSTGHFTQVVWKSSKRLGVGIAKNGGFTIVVARYSPPGNYRGQFQENVKKPRG